MKKNISQNEQHFYRIKDEFTGKNLTRFGRNGLITRFFRRHKIRKHLDNRIKIEGGRRSKYSPGSIITNCLYGIFFGYSRPTHMEVLAADSVFQKVTDLPAFPVQLTISRFLKALKVSAAREIASFNSDLLTRFRGGFKAYKTITLISTAGHYVLKLEKTWFYRKEYHETLAQRC